MKIKIAAIVMAIVMIAGIAVFAITGRGGKEEEVIKEPVAYSYENSELTAKVSVAGADGQVYLPTDQTNLYYTATLDNKIEFYNYTGAGFTKASYSPSKITFYLSATYESIPVTVTLIETDKFTIGYGVFTADMDKSVDIYDFAFVKIVVAPEGYGIDSGYLLLADFNKDDFYKADKTYSEIYKFNKNNTKVSTALSNNTRLIDRNGGFRQDWSMLTDEFIKNLGSGNYFMSSRYYTEEETGKRTDIMVYSNAYRPTIVVEDIVGTWFVNDDNGMHYLKKTDSGFESVKVKDKDSVTIAKLEGDFFEDYLRDEQYVVNKKTGEMTDLMSGEKSKFGSANLSNATYFSISSDGNRAVFAFPGEENENGVMVQKLILCTADGTKAAEIYSEPLLFSESSQFIWLDDNNVMFVRALDQTGETFGSVIYTY